MSSSPLQGAPGTGATSPGGSSADSSPDVRPARLDRPLNAGPLGPMYADDRLRELVEQAAAQAREQARAQGYASGWAQGRRAGEADIRADQERIEAAGQAARAAFAQQAATALQALADAADASRSRELPVWDELGEAIMDGALALARAVLARELSTVDAEVVEAIGVALRTLGEPDEVVAEVSPDDYVLLGQLPAGTLSAGVRVRKAADVPPGAARVSEGSRQALVSLSDAVERAAQVLRS